MESELKEIELKLRVAPEDIAVLRSSSHYAQPRKVCGIPLWALADRGVTGDNIINRLRDVGCVVADPFKVFDTK